LTTRKLLVEQVRRKLAGGNVPNNFPITELEIGKMVDQSANAVIATQCLQGLWDDYLTEYEDLPIKLDEKKNLYYTDLPAKVISLPNQLGVFQVSTMQDQSSIFIPTTVNSQWLYPNLAEILQGNSGYYNEQKKIYFVNYNPNDNTDTILLKLIVDRSELDEEADYQIPPSIEEIIYATVLNKFSGK
jgi:hypothetical protein